VEPSCRSPMSSSCASLPSGPAEVRASAIPRATRSAEAGPAAAGDMRIAREGAGSVSDGDSRRAWPAIGWQLSSLQAIVDPVALATIDGSGRRSGAGSFVSVPKDATAEDATTTDWLCLTLPILIHGYRD
jgi:hypothetical protein